MDNSTVISDYFDMFINIAKLLGVIVSIVKFFELFNHIIQIKDKIESMDEKMEKMMATIELINKNLNLTDNKVNLIDNKVNFVLALMNDESKSKLKKE
ncbi:unnamed protein product [Rhizophagus irregularis]|nr:unnamed protein product [Rhizophagus irregularis]